MKAAISSVDICYLLLFPFFELPDQPKHITLQSPKDAPYFYELDIDVRCLHPIDEIIENTRVRIVPQIFDEDVFVFECTYTIHTPEEATSLELNSIIQKHLKQKLRTKYLSNMSKILEEYTIILGKTDGTKPDEFVDKHAGVFAGFIRNTYGKILEKEKIKDILKPRARYSEQDLVVIDWNGAVIFAEDGDFQSDIEVLKIGNYQLLRYRMLDEVLEQKLNYLRDATTHSKIGLSLKGNSLMHEIVKQRLSILLTLEKLDTSLILIGDWYSSHLYRIIFEEFYIDRWKTIVETKLDNLKSLNETINDNLSLSWRKIIDQITFIGWFVMMIGYFILFYVDLRNR